MKEIDLSFDNFLMFVKIGEAHLEMFKNKSPVGVWITLLPSPTIVLNVSTSIGNILKVKKM